jgi:hypothetical protein
MNDLHLITTGWSLNIFENLFASEEGRLVMALYHQSREMQDVHLFVPCSIFVQRHVWIICNMFGASAASFIPGACWTEQEIYWPWWINCQDALHTIVRVIIQPLFFLCLFPEKSATPWFCVERRIMDRHITCRLWYKIEPWIDHHQHCKTCWDAIDITPFVALTRFRTPWNESVCWMNFSTSASELLTVWVSKAQFGFQNFL